MVCSHNRQSAKCAICQALSRNLVSISYVTSFHSFLTRQVSGIRVLLLIVPLPLLSTFTNLTCYSYFHLKHIKVICYSVSSSILSAVVCAFRSSLIDYCNSILFRLPKVHLSPLQSIFNTAARLIAHLPR